MTTRILILILALATFGAQRSIGYVCGGRPNRPGNCGDLKATGPSFVGTVIDIENPPDQPPLEYGQARYRFRIDENISGFDGKEVDVYSGRGGGGGDCSYHFKKGESYLVTPYRDAKTTRYSVTICGGTQSTATAGALLAELRARKRGSVIEGVLYTKEPPYDYNYTKPDVTVELRGQNFALTAQTDSHGAYRFTGIPAGTYHLAAKLPPDFPRLANDPTGDPPSIAISEQSCYVKNLYALPARPPSP
jgi:hypothetical protein